MSKYEYKIYHKETGEEIPEENFSQYFSHYVALDSDGDLVDIDSRDSIDVNVVDYAYIKFNKSDEYEAKAEAFDAILKAYDEAFSREHMADEVIYIIEKYESGEYDA